MKTATAKMSILLAGFALVVMFCAVASIIGARAVAAAQNAQDALLLVALAFGGAAASMINGINRRSRQTKRAAGNGSVKAEGHTGLRSASMINLGY